jgi:uncharacterized protein
MLNAEVVQAIYDAWAREERPGPVELLDAQIEYVNPAGALEPGTRRGLSGFADAVEKTYEGWDAWEMKLERLHVAGDRVAVVVQYRARGRGSGVELEGRESALWTIRDGKAVRYEWFHGPGDALDAIGLEE